MEDAAERLEGEAKTAVFAGWDGEVRGVLAVADTLKDGAAELVNRLHAMGLEVAMLTGDNARTAQAIAGRVGSTGSWPKSSPTTRSERWRSCSARGAWWPWWGTASTTRRPWSRPTSASPSGPAPMSPSRPAT